MLSDHLARYADRAKTKKTSKTFGEEAPEVQGFTQGSENVALCRKRVYKLLKTLFLVGCFTAPQFQS